jgi:hypothetical protein
MTERAKPLPLCVPAELLPPLKAIKNTFEDAFLKFCMVTEQLCNAHLRLNSLDGHIQRNVMALNQLKLAVAPEVVKRFELAMTDRSLSVIFLGYFDFFSEGLAGQIDSIVDDLLAIGMSNRRILPIEPITWAMEQAHELIESKVFMCQWWARRACDGRGLDAIRRMNHVSGQTPESPLCSSVPVKKNWDDHITEFATCQEWLSSPARHEEEHKGNLQGIENVRLHALEHLSALVDLDSEASGKPTVAAKLHYHLMPFVDDIRDWVAPRFTSMLPVGRLPYQEFGAWNRLSVEETRELVNVLCERYTYVLKQRIGRTADAYTVAAARHSTVSATKQVESTPTKRPKSKENTQATYAAWQARYISIKAANKDMPDTTIAEKIASEKLGKGKSASTIRHNMKP